MGRMCVCLCAYAAGPRAEIGAITDTPFRRNLPTSICHGSVERAAASRGILAAGGVGIGAHLLLCQPSVVLLWGGSARGLLHAFD